MPCMVVVSGFWGDEGKGGQSQSDRSPKAK